MIQPTRSRRLSRHDVLTPRKAVVWAAFFNLVAAFLFDVQVAKTIGQGLIELTSINEYVILSGLTGAIVWNLVTWYFGIPTSSSHALIGGYAGAAISKAGFGTIIVGGWTKTLIFIVVAPVMGMVIGLHPDGDRYVDIPRPVLSHE